MPRSRVIVVDDEEGWIIREELTLDPASPVAPEDDYIVVQPGFPVHYNAESSYAEIVVWGVGLISFGPVTAEQTAFMANLGTSTDLSLFPGDYAAFGFSAQQLDSFQYGIKADFVYVGQGTTTLFTITPDGLTVVNASDAPEYFGFDFGGVQGTSTSSSTGVNLFFADLDVTSGTDAPNIIVGTDGPETLLGLGGNDHLIGNGGGDRLDGGEGEDLLEGGDGNDRLYGENGNDELRGGPGSDLLFGGDGNDLLNPGAGSANVDGGAGTDRLQLDYGSNDTSVYFQFVPGTFVLTPDGGGISAVNVEAMIVNGSNYSDVLIGTDFNDELYGGNGFDLLRGGAGNDLLDSGANSGAPVAILPTAGVTRETALPIDHFFTLNADSNIFDSTTVPHATLNVDVHTGSSEFDQETRRYVSFSVAAGATLTIDVDQTFFEVNTSVAIHDSSGNLVASNDDGDYSIGGLDPGTSNGSDSLLSFTFASAGTYSVEVTSFIANSNHTSSFSVNFSLTSASVASQDVLEGGAGDDSYIVYSASDQVIENANEGIDTVRSSVTLAVADNVENLNLTGSAAINGIGNELGNQLTGNSGRNVLVGGEGADTLRGGASGDVFVFTESELGTTRAGPHDVIADWQRGDRIDISALYEGVMLKGLKNGKASDVDTLSNFRAITYTVGGNTYISGDTDGIAGADFTIELTGSFKLKSGDLIVNTRQWNQATGGLDYDDYHNPSSSLATGFEASSFGLGDASSPFGVGHPSSWFDPGII